MNSKDYVQEFGLWIKQDGGDSILYVSSRLCEEQFIVRHGLYKL